jgi:hypothetical protein
MHCSPAEVTVSCIIVQSTYTASLNNILHGLVFRSQDLKYFSCEWRGETGLFGHRYGDINHDTSGPIKIGLTQF